MPSVPTELERWTRTKHPKEHQSGCNGSNILEYKARACELSRKSGVLRLATCLGKPRITFQWQSDYNQDF